jgi:F420-dependent oxidoreductase-like protein
VLVGPSASGKSTWADQWFAPGQVVSADRLRALVGEGEHDQRAGTDAFAVLDLVLERRLRRRLLTVVDTLGLDRERRRSYVALGRRHGLPVVAVAFDVPDAECRARNRLRPRPVPSKVLSGQLARWAEARDELAEDDFDAVHPPAPVEVVHPELVSAPAAALRQREEPMPLSFGLQIATFEWPPEELGRRLAGVARAAEAAGFTSVWVMDHFIQIPPVGPHWQNMLDSYSALSFLAAHTERATLGPLVTGVTYRNIAHLAKIVATLDVLSGGRAVCGIGAGWFEREHKAYGFDFPPLRRRYELLEDALRLFPLMWGPGAPAFEGTTIRVAEALCYPRPVQERIPIMVGGSGERKTLRLVAQYADACNLVGDPAAVRHKLDVLRRHCEDVGRDPSEIRVTHLASALDAPVDDHIGRYRQLAEAGVQTAMVRFPVLDEAAVEAFAPVVAAFSTPGDLAAPTVI